MCLQATFTGLETAVLNATLQCNSDDTPGSTGGTCQHQLTGLHGNEPYFVRVSARNAFGTSQSAISTPAHASPCDQAPGSPRGVVFARSREDYPGRLELAWNAP